MPEITEDRATHLANITNATSAEAIKAIDRIVEETTTDENEKLPVFGSFVGDLIAEVVRRGVKDPEFNLDALLVYFRNNATLGLLQARADQQG